MPIPVVNLRPSMAATESDWRARLDVLFARAHFVLGEELAAFEGEFAEALGAKHAVGVANGTAAIELCLREAAVQGQVLTSALTAPFTGVAIQTAGCTPVFADVNPDTLQMDAGDAGNRMNKRVAALLPVHLYGQPCDIGRFSGMARAAGKVLVQDACQAHGAQAEKVFTSYSRHVAYSFYPTKNLGCLGDGGAILTDSSAVAKRLRMLRDGGRRGDQVSHIPGINSRLDEIQCCFLRSFLPHLADWNTRRSVIAQFYDQALGDCQGIRAVLRTPNSVNHLYVIRAARRDTLRKFLAGHGIGTGIHYPVPLHLHPSFQGSARKGDLPHAEKACREIVSLPLWPYMTEAQAAEVADRIRQFYS